MNIILGGALGRMGQEIRKMGGEMNVVCGVDSLASGNEDFPLQKEYELVNVPADCIVDFSRPSALEGLLKLALRQKLPAVLCATGYSEEDLARIAEAAKSIPILRSANMSLGVNVLAALCRSAAAVLRGFDMEITETHHRMKADAPSGTALLLRDALLDGLGEDRPSLYGREGRSCPRENEIGIHALRGGTVVGEHSVFFLGSGEELVLTHRAENRGLFAQGAAAAARWIVKQPAGLYSMQDLVAEILEKQQTN